MHYNVVEQSRTQIPRIKSSLRSQSQSNLPLWDGRRWAKRWKNGVRPCLYMWLSLAQFCLNYWITPDVPRGTRWHQREHFMPPSHSWQGEGSVCERERLRGLISRLQIIFLAHPAHLQSLGTRGLVVRLKCFSYENTCAKVLNCALWYFGFYIPWWNVSCLGKTKRKKNIPWKYLHNLLPHT